MDRILFVIAHPDDEAMFFAPVILNLAKANTLYLLCLSTGNADGLGKVREKELHESCKILKFTDTSIIDDPRIQDGMQMKWEKSVVSEYTNKYIQVNSITKVITFDEFGISSHQNHIDVYLGVKTALSKLKHIKGYKLITTNIFRKYVGCADILVSKFNCESENTFVVPFNEMGTSLRAMRAHYSQFVWFRKLFIIFSRYSYVNTLAEIK